VPRPRPPSDEHLDGALLVIAIIALLALLWALMLMG
jgi:hypothetical protein